MQQKFQESPQQLLLRPGRTRIIDGATQYLHTKDYPIFEGIFNFMKMTKER